MQLSGSDEMGRIERGVPSSIGRDTSRFYCTRQHRCLVEDRWRNGVLEASGVVEVVVWRRLDRWRSGLHELHCFVLFVTCQQWPLEHRTTASCSNRVDC